MNKQIRVTVILTKKTIRSHFWLYIKLTMAFASIILMVLLSLTYITVFNNTQNELLSESISSNYFIFEQPIDAAPNMEKLEIQYYDFVPHAFQLVGEDAHYLAIHDIIIKSDGKQYSSATDYNWERIDIYSGYFITQNDMKELSRRYGVNTCIIGSFPSADNEILISEKLLDWLGFTESIIGKTVTIFTSNKTLMLESMTVCGIIRSEYYSLAGHTYEGFIVPSIVLSPQSVIFRNSQYVKTKYIYSCSDWMNFESVDAILNHSEGYYVGQSILGQISTINNLQEIATQLFLFIGISLGMGNILLILLMIIKFITLISYDRGVFLSCGMHKRQNNSLMYSILLCVCATALLIAIVLAIPLYYIINHVILKFYVISIEISFAITLVMLLVGILTVLALVSVCYLYVLNLMRKKTIKELLNTKMQ